MYLMKLLEDFHILLETGISMFWTDAPAWTHQIAGIILLFLFVNIMWNIIPYFGNFLLYIHNKGCEIMNYIKCSSKNALIVTTRGLLNILEKPKDK